MQGRRVLMVARREIRYTVLTKAFLFAIIGVPILISAAIAVTAIMMSQHEELPLTGRIMVLESGGDVLPIAKTLLGKPGGGSAVGAAHDDGEMPRPAIEQDIVESAARMLPQNTLPNTALLELHGRSHDEDAFPSDVESHVASGDLLAAVLIPASVLEPSPGRADVFQLLVSAQMDSDHVTLLERQFGEAIIRARVRRTGNDPDSMQALLRVPDVHTGRQSPDGTIRSDSAGMREVRRTLIPLVFMMLIWGSTFTTGNQLLMTTIEEKSSRVVEVILSAVSPMTLMTGKILGQGAVGLIIMTVYSSLGILGLVTASRMDLVEPWQLALLGVYFFMAFFMIASLMAAVGSAVSELREANSLLTPVLLLTMIPLILWTPISASPNGTIATVFSFLPPAIPFVMILRITAEEIIPPWQILMSIAWGSACTVLMFWCAARVFRVGILMTGKPPSLRQLLRWVRYR